MKDDRLGYGIGWGMAKLEASWCESLTGLT